jgi:hypothetical protein
MTTETRSLLVTADGRQSAAATDIARGVMRMMAGLGYACVPELPLASGLRADITAIDRDGRIWIVEIKSSLADFRADQKWQGYLSFCDQFSFAVNAEFPLTVLPEGQGLIMADRYGAAIIHPSSPQPSLAAARRKAMTLRIARIAAGRLAAAFDPELHRMFNDGA